MDAQEPLGQEEGPPLELAAGATVPTTAVLAHEWMQPSRSIGQTSQGETN